MTASARDRDRVRLSDVPADGDALVLNPLALSSETNGRFRMLMLAAFVITWSLAGYWIPAEVLPVANAAVALRPFAISGDAIVAHEGQGFWEIMARMRSSPELDDAVLGHVQRLNLAFILIVTYVVVSRMLYRLLSGWTLRSQGTRKLDPKGNPRLASELEDLTRSSGLGAPIEWYLRPGYLDGRASGSSARPRLVLTGDPERLERGLGGAFRAVALHELGHVVNRDVETREKARAAWLTFGLLAALTPLALWVWPQPRIAVVAMALRLGASALVVMGLWAGLVRTREYFADAWVAARGHASILRRRLSLAAASSAFGASTGALGRLRRVMTFHPTNRERLRNLARPRRLFRVSPLLAFLTATLLSLTVGYLGIPAMQLLTVFGGLAAICVLAAGGAIPFGPAMLVLLLAGAALSLTVISRVTEALGIQVLRSAVGDLSSSARRGWGHSSLLAPAAAFGVGVELGLWLTPLGGSVWREPSMALAWMAMFTLLVWMWLIQARALGLLVLATTGGEAAPALTERWLHRLLTLLFLPVACPGLLGRALLALSAGLSQADATDGIGIPPDAFIALCVDWGFALLTVALLGCTILGLLTFAGVGWRLASLRYACERCGEPWPRWYAVGLRCRGCGEPAAAWLYLKAATPETQP